MGKVSAGVGCLGKEDGEPRRVAGHLVVGVFREAVVWDPGRNSLGTPWGHTRPLRSAMGYSVSFPNPMGSWGSAVLGMLWGGEGL